MTAFIREEAAAAQRERIAGMDLAQMTDEQLRDLLVGALNPGPKPDGSE